MLCAETFVCILRVPQPVLSVWLLGSFIFHLVFGSHPSGSTHGLFWLCVQKCSWLAGETKWVAGI